VAAEPPKTPATSPLANITAEESLQIKKMLADDSLTVFNLWPSRVLNAWSRLDRSSDTNDATAQLALDLLARILRTGEIEVQPVEKHHRPSREWVGDVNLDQVLGCLSEGESDDACEIKPLKANLAELNVTDPTSERTARATMHQAILSFRTVALVGLQRWVEAETFGQGGSAGYPAKIQELDNVQFHVLPANVHAHEVEYVSADPFLPTGIFVAEAPTDGTTASPESGGVVPGIAMTFIDPRGDSPNILPLPEHLGITKSWPVPLEKGKTIIFPGKYTLFGC
jgi:hypothetical protein